MDKKDFLLTTLDRIQEWIRAADQKVSIFLAFQGLILTILLPSLPAWLLRYHYYLPCLVQPVLWLGLICIFASLIISIMAVSPVLKHQNPTHSLTFFGDISNMDRGEYKKKLNELTDPEYEEELISQVHINAKIASRKHSRFKWSVITFFSGGALLILGFLLML